MLRDSPNVNYFFSRLVVEELTRFGIEWFVVCPGSRSAPLAWAIAEHPRAKVVVHHDERGAAFHALGLAKGSGKPAVFVCTSGSAVANALPAVVEASHSGVPMILLTADRPPRLQGTGANQTINQRGIYREFVHWERNFVVDATTFDVDDVLAPVDAAFSRATGWNPGPVHLNCMLDEPLAPEPPAGGAPDWSRHLETISSWVKSSAPIQFITSSVSWDNGTAPEQALNAISAATRGLVLLGQLPWSGHDKVVSLLERLRWPVIADVTSGLRLRTSPYVAHYGIHGAEKWVGAADVLIHLGGPLTSRKNLDALSRYRGHYIRVSPSQSGLDPFRNVTSRLIADVDTLDRLLSPARIPAAPAEWLAEVFKPESAIGAVLRDAFPDEQTASEPSVAYAVSSHPSTPYILFLGSSMPIRDMDLFGGATPGGPRVEANRGASGIDGNIATAAGVARATGQAVVAVLGDLATLHDLNSLALLRDLTTPFVLVTLNNNGGGIFSLLPIARHTQHFERFFGTPHGLEFSSAARMYGLEYAATTTNGEFRRELDGALARKGPTLLEIRTDRAQNAALHRELDARIQAELAGAR